MKRRTRKVITIILFIILVVSLGFFIRDQLVSRRSRQDYELALQIAESHTREDAATEEIPAETPAGSEVPAATERPVSDDPAVEQLLQMDLDALRDVNEDVLGWIHIPDSNISYPLLHWTDNDFYLTHTWNQSENPSGSIFMDYQCAPDFSDFNTIIYGHNMRNGDMFSDLTSFRYESFLRDHPSVYIACREGVLRYDVFAVQSVGTETIVYGIGIESEQRKKELIRFATDYSLVETEISPTTNDSILTLSTCVDSAHVNRWVVLCRLNEEGSYRYGE